MKYILLLLLLTSWALLQAVLNETELQIIDEMLTDAGLDMQAVNFPKDWGNPAFKIPKMIEMIEKPFEYPIFVEELKEKILLRDWLELYEYASEILLENSDLREKTVENRGHTHIIAPTNIKRPLDILKYAEYVYEVSYQAFQQSIATLDDIERLYLEKTMYELAIGGNEDNAKYAEFLKKYAPPVEAGGGRGGGIPEIEDEAEYLIEIIKKIDFSALFASAQSFYAGMTYLSDIDLSHLNYRKPVKYRSRHGLMIVGTAGNDAYTDDFVFIYDPAGNDTYSFDMSTNIDKPFLTVIDLAGDDIYRNAKIGQLFTALYGNVYHYDRSGNDYYYGDDLAFSANIGSLLSIDKAGADTYITGSKTLGAGTLGIAFVINIGGNDVYSATCYSQGFGGILGIGMLADLSENQTPNTDNDTYIAGGRYKHAPLVPNDYRSMSQGFGFGWRPDIAGGIGILFDEAGNDHYNAGVYAQGVAYWYALGILIDLEGNDSYNAVYYPQGSGIHLAAGFLYDADGDDSYYSKHGPGQGAGHDYGVGFLVDKGGNDAFSVDGGNGLGLSNSVGIFIASGGKNRFERKNPSNYGHANVARESGSIGLFLALDGENIYSNENRTPDTHWTSGVYGLGKDSRNKTSEERPQTSEDTPQTSEDTPQTSEDTPQTSKDTPHSSLPIAHLFAMAAEWEVGSAVDRVRSARASMLERDIEAIEYIYERKLHTKSGLELRAIQDLLKNSKKARECLPDWLNHPHRRAIGNTIYLIGEIADTTFIATFEKMLSDTTVIQVEINTTEPKNQNPKPNYTNSILSALGNLKTDRSIDILTQYMHSDDVYRRVIVARSLKKLNTPRSIDLLLSMEDDDCFLIKTMIELITHK